MMTPPFAVAAPLASSADDAARILTAIHEGPTGPENAVFLEGQGLRVSGGPDRFDAWSDAGHLLYVHVDRARRQVAVQGHWWYRGEYQIVDDGTTARLVQRVLNVAPRRRWAVPFANRFFVGYRNRLEHSARMLAQRLDQTIRA